MQISITPGRARGTVKAPASKSMAHRLLIAAAMAEGESCIQGISSCEDVCATLDCLRAMGIKAEQAGDTVTVTGADWRTLSPSRALACRESGSTLRFMIPAALLSGREATLMGAPSLMRRPMCIYEEICREKQLYFRQEGTRITVKGPLPAGEYTLPGNVSSQFVTGLLFALAQAGESRIRILPPVESRSYIDLTVSAMREFGVNVVWERENILYIPKGSRYLPKNCSVEGDYSNAVFLEALGEAVTVEGLREDSLQGDRIYRKHLATLKERRATVALGDCPDLGPILFAVAAASHGGVFTGTRRLRIKESDRASAMAEELSKFGTRVIVEDDCVLIDPVDFHAPTATLCGHNDHRIVMSMAVLCTLTGGSIAGAEAVSKSYPEFFRDLRSLGIVCEEI